MRKEAKNAGVAALPSRQLQEKLSEYRRQRALHLTGSVSTSACQKLINEILRRCREEERPDIATRIWSDVREADRAVRKSIDANASRNGAPGGGSSRNGAPLLNHYHYSSYSLIVAMQRDAAPTLREHFDEFLSRTNAGDLFPTENSFAIFVRAGGYANAVDVSLSAFDEFLARSISPRNPRPPSDVVGALAISLAVNGEFAELSKLVRKAVTNGWVVDGVVPGALFECAGATLQEWEALTHWLETHANSTGSSASTIAATATTNGVTPAASASNNEERDSRDHEEEHEEEEEHEYESDHEILGAAMLRTMQLLRNTCLSEEKVEYSHGRALCALSHIKAYGHVIPMDSLFTSIGAVPTAYTCTMVMVAMLKEKRPRDALRYFDSIQRESFSPDSAVYYVKISAERHCRDWESILRTFQTMKRCGYVPYPRCYHSALVAATRLNRWSLCRQLLEDMQANGMEVEAALNIAVSGAQRVGKHDIVADLQTVLEKRNTSTNVYAYGVMLNNAEWWEAEEILKEMRAKGVQPTQVIKNIVMGVYVKARQLNKAEMLFDDLKANGEADIISFVQMVKGLIRAGDAEKAQQIWDEMADYNVVPNVVAFTTLIHELEKRGDHTKSLRVHDAMKAASVQPNTITYAALIKACGKAGLPDRAQSLFEEMLENEVAPNVIVYQNMLWTMMKAGRWEECKMTFKQMRNSNIKPDAIVWNTYIFACSKFGNLEETKKNFLEMRRRLGVTTDASCIALLLAHGRAGLIDEALSLFTTFTERKFLRATTKTLNTVLNACLKREDEDRFDKSLKLYWYMKDSTLSTIRPDAITYNMLMQAFNRGGRPQLALDLFGTMTAANITPDIETACTMMSSLGSLGRVDDAAHVMRTMHGQSTGVSSSAYSVMMNIYEQHGFYCEVIDLYKEMQKVNITPTMRSYKKVLYAAARRRDYETLSEAVRTVLSISSP